ncbi:MAG TPA: response regulator [Archaeoglobaceae archaeon]|nr:response regulator [Archaeoglobaceae archaeon]
MVVKILIVDDSQFMRKLLRRILESQPGYTIIGEAENGVEAVEKTKELDPDVVMMDIVMPIKDGISATAEIKSMSSKSRVVMCTFVGQEEKMKQAIKAGADGYITKPFQGPKVVEAIQGVLT